MHQSQIHNTPHHSEPQTTSNPGKKSNKCESPGSSEGMQSLAEDMKRISVSRSADNGVSAPQASGPRWTREGEGKDRSQRMGSRGMGQGWGTAGRGVGQGETGNWRSTRGQGSVEQQGERPLRYTRPNDQRHNHQANATDNHGSHHDQPRDQQSWRQTRAFPERESSPFTSSASNFRQKGEDARFGQDGHLQPNHFFELEANDSSRPTRTWRSKISHTLPQNPTEGNRYRIDTATSSPRVSTSSVNPLPIDPATRFVPITQTTAMPTHLQHPFRMYEPGTTFDISAALNAEPVTQRHPTAEYLTMAQASPNEYYTRPLRDGVDPRSTRKLVVLDLNGALLVRSKRSKISIENISRGVYPRPFLAPFLAYILKAARPLDDFSNPSDPTEQEMRPYEAFVWSSAQPINVDGMIRSAFGKWGMPTSPRAEDRLMCEEMLQRFEKVESRSGRILGVWTRDEMDLTRAQYGQKSLTYKDLEKVSTQFENLGYMPAEASRFYRPDPDFHPSLHSTLLVDDSTVKACMQPFNHIPIPEYTLEARRVTQAVLEKYEARASTDDLHQATNSSAEILEQIFGPATEFLQLTAPGASYGQDDAPKLDAILLGVVGILHEVKDVVNLPAWIAAGGLLPRVEHSFTPEMAGRGWQHVISLDSGSQTPNPNRKNGHTKPPTHGVPTLLPSHPDYKHWYESPLHLLYWVRRGLVALQERRIDPSSLE